MPGPSHALPPISIDKSFARAAPAEVLQKLAETFTFVVPAAFYYESFTSDQEDRRMTLHHFPGFRGIDLAELRETERVTGRPIDRVDLPELTFNPAYATGERNLLGEDAEDLADYEETIVRDGVRLWRAVITEGVLGFSPIEETVIKEGTEGEFKEVCAKLHDVDFVRAIGQVTGIPVADRFDESWIYFRSLQAWLLHGLSLVRRYRTPKDQISERNLEHDLHDLEYLILGLHTGRLATNEIKSVHTKIGWRFKFLYPDGMLIHRKTFDDPTVVLSP